MTEIGLAIFYYASFWSFSVALPIQGGAHNVFDLVNKSKERKEEGKEEKELLSRPNNNAIFKETQNNEVAVRKHAFYYRILTYRKSITLTAHSERFYVPLKFFSHTS